MEFEPVMSELGRDDAQVAVDDVRSPIPDHIDDEYPAVEAQPHEGEDSVRAVTTAQVRNRATPRTLQGLLAVHLEKKCLTARAFADQTGVSYPTVLSIINKGSMPRKLEHRESLREALHCDTDTWATVMALSGADQIDLGGEAPTLQQMVLKEILVRGQSEQSFATESGIPYPTILGVTRKGAIPRGETLVTITEALDLDPAEVTAAVDRSRAVRREGTPPVPDPQTQSLAQLVANTARRNGQSLAAFSRVHDLPYLVIMRLVGSGVPPDEADVLERLGQALGLDTDTLQYSVGQSRAQPEPASVGNDGPSESTPLQSALKSVIDKKGLTMKAFAELSELSVLTATRLVKHGAMPSRSATHAKLRSLLDLNENEYSELLRRSKDTPKTDVISDDDFQHQETEEITPDGEDREALAKLAVADPELAQLIVNLDHKKRAALKMFLKTLL